MVHEEFPDEHLHLEETVQPRIINELLHNLDKPETICVVLHGKPGVGKRSLVKIAAKVLKKPSCRNKNRGKAIAYFNMEEGSANERRSKLDEEGLRARCFTLGLTGSIVCIPEIQRLFERGVEPGKLTVYLGSPANKWVVTIPTSSFHKYIAASSQWDNRRFVKIAVPEMPESEVRKVLVRRGKMNEKRFGVQMEPSVIDDVLEICKQYLSGDVLPGIAVHLLDEASREAKECGSPDGGISWNNIAEIARKIAGISIPYRPGEKIPKKKDEEQQSTVSLPQDPPLNSGKKEVPTPVLVNKTEPAKDEQKICLPDFIAEFIFELGQTVSSKEIKNASLIKEMSEEQLLTYLPELLCEVKNSRPALTESELRSWEAMASFVEKVEVMVLDYLKLNAPTLLDSDKKLPYHQWELSAVLSKNPESCSSEKVARHLDVLSMWLEDTLTSVFSAFAEAFKIISERGAPDHTMSIDEALRKYRNWVELLHFNAQFKDKFREILKKTFNARRDKWFKNL